jgi:hypothetical protein
MNETQAEALANIVGGEAWQSGGGIWVVTVNRDDGSLVVFSGDAVCEYADDEAIDEGRASKSILLTDDDQWWVISDKDGNVIYRDARLEVGWRTQDEAEHEARGLASRTGERYLVREQ